MISHIIRYSSFYIILAILVAGVGWYGLSSTATTTQLAPPDASPTEQELHSLEYWRELIKLQGPYDAYEQISQYEPQGLPFIHGLAHTFGGALYDTDGVSAITFCDDRFLYGCVHEVVSLSLIDKGAGVVKELVAHCRELQRGTLAGIACEHGIGHGLIGHLGYSPEGLSTALTLCSDVVDQGYRPETQGCMGGVFMEYNIRALQQGEGGGALRPFAQHRNEPCDTLSGSDRLGCIYWQVQWWQQAILGGANDSKAQVTLGEYCDGLVMTPEEEQVCYGSIGTFITPATDFAYEPSAALCLAAATTDEQALYCAVRAYRTITKYTDATLDDVSAFCAIAVNDVNRCSATIAALHGAGEHGLTDFLYSPLVSE